MPAENHCPTCGQRWESAEPDDGNCPRCHGIIAGDHAATTATEALREGEPPFVLPWHDELDIERRVVRPPTGWGWLSVAAALLALSAGVEVLQMSAEIEKASAIGNILRGAQHNLESAKQLANFFGYCGLVLFIAAGAITYFWTSAVYRNFNLLRVQGVTRSPDAAVAACQAPWRLFWIPYRLIQEYWMASDPAAPADSLAWKDGRPSWLIRAWWTLFLVRHLRIVINVEPFPFHDEGSLIVMYWFSVSIALSCLAGAAAAILFCVIMLQVERRQWRRFDRLQDL